MVTAELIKIVEAQVEAWNRGDLDGFLKPYLNDQRRTMIIGSFGVIQGFEAIKNHYLKKMEENSTLGELSVSNLQEVEINPTASFLNGHFSVQLNNQRNVGLFSLLFIKIGDESKIVCDYTIDFPNNCS